MNAFEQIEIAGEFSPIGIQKQIVLQTDADAAAEEDRGHVHPELKVAHPAHRPQRLRRQLRKHVPRAQQVGLRRGNVSEDQVEKMRSCFNQIAYRSFIESKDRSVFDLDLVFKFKADEIHIDENGIFELEVMDLLDYGIEKYLLCKYKDRVITILLEGQMNYENGEKIKASIDIDKMQVFDKEKGIKLV